MPTGGGWRAVTKAGASGPGCMNYDLDMPPYVHHIAAWLDDDRKVHPFNLKSVYVGFQIVMALCRSAVNGSQISLPLTDATDEIQALSARPAGRQGAALHICEREGVPAVETHPGSNCGSIVVAEQRATAIWIPHAPAPGAFLIDQAC